VQILVRVANTQERTLWAEVEKGFARTAFGRESVGPKESAKAVGPGRWRFTASSPADQKGIRSTFRNQDLACAAATRANSETFAAALGRVLFSS